MLFLYNLLIRLAAFVVRIQSVFNAKSRQFVTGRKNLFSVLENELKGPVIWFHCASLGEFEQGRPLMEGIKEQYPGLKILLTFFSPSGYEVRKNYAGADYIFYLPWDTASNARRFISIVKPSLVIFIKYEFWYHFINELKKQNIPVLSVSSIFRPQQVYFRWYGNFFRTVLKNITHFFVQNEQSKDLLKSIGITSVTVAGDTRFDRVFAIAQSPKEIHVIRSFKDNQKIMVAGSVWDEDLDVLIPFINTHTYQLKFILVPHEIEASAIEQITQKLKVPYFLFSNPPANPPDYQVVIVDAVGFLSSLYSYGEFAFVGGAYGKGLHNILEAACYGIPVFFGDKRYKKFQEATTLIRRGGAFTVKNTDDLVQKYEMINQPEYFIPASDATRLYVEENLGATATIMSYCKQFLQ